MKKQLIFGPILIAIVLSGVYISYSLLINKCLPWRCAPDREYEMGNFNIDLEYLGLDINYTPLTPFRDFPSIDEGISALEWESGVATYTIRRFASSYQASDWFEKSVDSLENDFDSNKFEEIEYSSSFAHEYVIRCGDVIGIGKCYFFSTYEEFYITFVSTIDEKMTVDNYLTIIGVIDTNVIEVLNP